MKIKLIYVAKKAPLALENLCHDYILRFQKEWHFQAICVRPTDKENEAKKIRELLPKKNFYLIALDERGQSFDSLQFSKFLKNLEEHQSQIIFLIGGSDGLAPSIQQQAHFLLRLSDLTLPHALARLVLCEQIYRAYSLINHLPYHRA